MRDVLQIPLFTTLYSHPTNCYLSLLSISSDEHLRVERVREGIVLALLVPLGDLERERKGRKGRCQHDLLARRGVKLVLLAPDSPIRLSEGRGGKDKKEVSIEYFHASGLLHQDRYSLGHSEW